MAKRRVQPKRARAQTANMGRRRRKRRGRRVLFYGLLLFCLLTVGAVYFFTEYMKIEVIEVVGVEKYTPDEITAASGIVLEENLLKVDKDVVQQKLLDEFPYIRSVVVRNRYWPPRVVIEVEQAEPVGAISDDGEVVLIDDEGKVLERGVLLIPETLLLVKGIDAAGMVPGDYLGAYTAPDLQLERKALESALESVGLIKEEREKRVQAEMEKREREEQEKREHAAGIRERLVMLQYLLAAMAETEFTQLTNVDLSDRLNMRINYENRITLELGSESQLLDKLRTAQYILQTDIGPEESGTLDVTEIDKDRARFDPVSNRRYHYSAEEAQSSQPAAEQEMQESQDKTEM